MNRSRLPLGALALLLLSTGCRGMKIRELEDRVVQLENRVSMLEGRTPAVPPK